MNNSQIQKNFVSRQVSFRSISSQQSQATDTHRVSYRLGCMVKSIQPWHYKSGDDLLSTFRVIIDNHETRLQSLDRRSPEYKRVFSRVNLLNRILEFSIANKGDVEIATIGFDPNCSIKALPKTGVSQVDTIVIKKKGQEPVTIRLSSSLSMQQAGFLDEADKWMANYSVYNLVPHPDQKDNDLNFLFFFDIVMKEGDQYVFINKVYPPISIDAFDGTKSLRDGCVAYGRV